MRKAQVWSFIGQYSWWHAICDIRFGRNVWAQRRLLSCWSSCIVAESNPVARKNDINKDGLIIYRTMLMKPSTSWSMHLIKKGCSVGYVGNIVDLWERLVERDVHVHLEAIKRLSIIHTQGGYFPAGLSFDDAQQLMHKEPSKFKEMVQDSLRRHVGAVNSMSERGMFFWDYGNAFLLESGRAGADVSKKMGRISTHHM